MSWLVAPQDISCCPRRIRARQRSKNACQVFGQRQPPVLTAIKCLLLKQAESRFRGVLNAKRAKSASFRLAAPQIAPTVLLGFTNTLLEHMHVSSALSIRIGREFKLKAVGVGQDFMVLLLLTGTALFVPTITTAQAEATVGDVQTEDFHKMVVIF